MVRPAGHMYAPGVPLSSLKRLVHGGWEESMVISWSVEKFTMCDSVVRPKYVTQKCCDSKW